MILTILIIVLSILLIMYKVKLKNFIKILIRDLTFFTNIVLCRVRIRAFVKKETVVKIFNNVVSKHPNKIAFYFEDEQWTFLDVEIYSNKIAHFFKKEGYQREEKVALLLENRPEYGCIWLGLGKIGVITVFINTNLIGDSLINSIKDANVEGIIYSSTLKNVIQNIAAKIPNVKHYQLVDKNDKCELLDGSVNLTTELTTQSKSSPTEEIEKGKITDKLILIYTSGTTGFPKPTVFTNKRLIYINVAINTFAKLTSEDVCYGSLPLYHGAGTIGVIQCFLFGVTLAIRKKFSASNFWNDCIKYKCTVAQYIGELCRYVLMAHNNQEFHFNHNVKKIIGNGLRPQIWEEFTTKFHIKEVYESYAATDGNANIMNPHNKIGAVGFFPRWASFLSPVKLIKCHMETGLPIKGNDGFYQLCKSGEPGLLLGKVDFENNSTGFVGYLNEDDTEKKLLKNVFKIGDAYNISGDILVHDDLGYFYFRDRTGDTFRWKGENVSTAEVEGIISKVLNHDDSVVYGVKLPGAEGKAGMVALVDSTQSLDMKKFYENLKKNLPFYAVPLFVRVTKNIPLTGTFKLQKRYFRREGSNVEKIKDQMFVFDKEEKTYIRLTKKKYDDIISGKINF